MYTKQDINNWLNEVIEFKLTIYVMLGITDDEKIIDPTWNAWGEVTGKLNSKGIFTMGKSVDQIKAMMMATLFLIFFSSCQTQQREQSITQAENQTAIESIHATEKEKIRYETSELLKVLRGYIKQAETDPIYKNLAQRLLITISQNNKTYGFGLDEQLEYHQKEIEQLKN